jgi:hypothetical protein
VRLRLALTPPGVATDLGSEHHPAMRCVALLALFGSVVLGSGCGGDVDFTEGSGGEGGTRSTGGEKAAGGGSSGGRTAGDGSAPNPGDGGGQALGGESGAAGGMQPSAGGQSGSGGHSGVGGSTSGTSAQEFCDGLLERYCAFNENCYGNDCTVLIGTVFGRTQSCLDAVAAVEAGALEFHAEAAQGCLDDVAAQDCSVAPGGFPGPLCPQVFQGKLALGDECSGYLVDSGVYDECGAGYCKRPATGPFGQFTCSGTCTGYLGLGEDCSYESESACGPELSCWNGKCASFGQEGDDCETNPCDAPFICSSSSPKTCKKLGAVGASCGLSAECEPPAICYQNKCTLDQDENEPCEGDASCRAGLYCHQGTDVESTTCRVPNQPGDTCESGDECILGYACTLVSQSVCEKAYGAKDEPCGVDGCVSGLWCDGSQSDSHGACVPVRGNGGGCVDHDSCDDGLYCMSDSKCHAPGKKDDPCAVSTGQTCEAGLYCDRQSKTCLEPRAEGEPCNPMTPAESCEVGTYCACLDTACPSAYSEAPDTKYLCVPRKADGEDCSLSFECLGKYCVDLNFPRKCASEPVFASECSR